MKKTLSGKYIVWIDVDEVLLYFRPMFNQHLREKHKIDIENDFMSSDWNYTDILPKEIPFSEFFNSLPENWTEHQEAYTGAYDFVKTIKKMGYYIILITSVPEKQVHYRLKNLNQHGIYYDEIYFTTSKKSFYAKEALNRFKGSSKIKNILIDDRSLNCVDFLENVPNVIKAFTLDVKYNREEKKLENKFKGKLDFSSKNTDELQENSLKFLKKIKEKDGRRLNNKYLKSLK